LFFILQKQKGFANEWPARCERIFYFLLQWWGKYRETKVARRIEGHYEAHNVQISVGNDGETNFRWEMENLTSCFVLPLLTLVKQLNG
jgi:hypothetical protein